jgi:hypothetical protein
MRTQKYITINEFCVNNNIENSFMSSLQQTGLIEISTINETEFIGADQLPQLEKIVHFYYELDINMEGIETVSHLLKRMTELKDEIIALKNRLRLYEG